jgi:hypothetical protein
MTALIKSAASPRVFLVFASMAKADNLTSKNPRWK